MTKSEYRKFKRELTKIMGRLCMYTYRYKAMGCCQLIDCAARSSNVAGISDAFFVIFSPTATFEDSITYWFSSYLTQKSVNERYTALLLFLEVLKDDIEV